MPKLDKRVVMFLDVFTLMCCVFAVFKMGIEGNFSYGFSLILPVFINTMRLIISNPLFMFNVEQSINEQVD